MKTFIITSDDYGMCVEVNKAIDDCMAVGLVTSTNVIVNMDAIEAASTLRSRYPNVSVGIHWNVTSGKPLCSIDDIPTLVDEKGSFYSVKEFIKRYKKGLIRKEHIEKELYAQYELFQKLCGKADYWNVHQNSSLDFKTFPVFDSVAHNLGIYKTRSFKRVYLKEKGIKGGVVKKILEAIKQLILTIWFDIIIPRGGTKVPDGRVMYFSDDAKVRDIRNIGDNIDWRRAKIVELVIHPAISGDSPYFGTISETRVDEWKMFSSAKTLSYIKSCGIEVSNFDCL